MCVSLIENCEKKSLLYHNECCFMQNFVQRVPVFLKQNGRFYNETVAFKTTGLSLTIVNNDNSLTTF